MARREERRERSGESAAKPRQEAEPPKQAEVTVGAKVRIEGQ